MTNQKPIFGSQIKNLITKFYYKNNHLCFQIMLHFNWDKTVPYMEFTDYSEYKKTYASLQTAKSTNQAISMPGSTSKLTNVTFA